MGQESIQLLCTGDLHLGRHPTRIPERLDGPEFSPRSIWQDIVREAIDCEVDVVVLTGDIADRENRYFEAYGAFEAGVIELDDADIPVVTVAGNHDSEFLPRMVDDIDIENLRLLGAGGKWERWTLEKDGTKLAHFDGWSFPHQHVSTSPFEQYDLPKQEDAPQIGVIHADLDTPRSRYAPVESSELRKTPQSCWLLGHIHVPEIRIKSDPLTLYPGSPQALDPSEQGVHGPWLITVQTDGIVEAEKRPIGTVCYKELPVDVSDTDDLQTAGSLISWEMRKFVEEELNTRNVSAFLPRVRLTGRTPAHTQLVDGKQTLEDQLSLKDGSIDIHIESVEVDTRPDIDLEEKAADEGPVSYLAKLLLALEAGELNEEYNQLVDGVQNRMREAHNANPYNLLRRESSVNPPEREKAIQTLEQEVRVLLDTLVQQKEEQP